MGSRPSAGGCGRPRIPLVSAEDRAQNTANRRLCLVRQGLAILVVVAIVVGDDPADVTDVAEEVTQPATDESGSTVAEQSPPQAPGSPKGTTRVNQWDVKVAEEDRDASAAIENANSFNEDPDYGYVIVTLEGTNGAAVVKDLQSFTVKFQGADKVVYRDDSFLMVMPRELATEAAPGGTVRAQFVFDLPPSAFGQGAVVLVDGVPVALPS